MSINLPDKVRAAIYVVLGIGGIVMVYLSSIGVVGQNELTAWAGLSSFVGGLAALNTPPSNGELR